MKRIIHSLCVEDVFVLVCHPYGTIVIVRLYTGVYNCISHVPSCILESLISEELNNRQKKAAKKVIIVFNTG